LQTPASFGIIRADWVEEIELEEDIFSHHHLLLTWAHGVSEVLIECKTVRVFDRESFELIVISHLVRRCHLVGTDWDGLAVNLDSSDCIDESIKFQEVLWRWFDFDTGL